MRTLTAMLEVSTLQKQVRYGTLPDDPNILESYLRSSEFSSNYPKKLAKLSSRKALNTLIETICDDLVPQHWREHCLNNLYRPLASLYRLTNDEEERSALKKEHHRISILCNYFMGTHRDRS